MTRNPILNGLAGVLYIVLFAAFVSGVSYILPETNNPIAPIIAVLSLFVFSAAVMGYIILGAPLQMFLEGEKKEAVKLFFKTLLAFAGIALVFFFGTLLIPFGGS
jgi:hypothetical protein